MGRENVISVAVLTAGGREAHPLLKGCELQAQCHLAGHGVVDRVGVQAQRRGAWEGGFIVARKKKTKKNN